MDASRSELVAAYWLYHAMSQGVRAERLESDLHLWACEAVSELVFEGDPLSAIVVVDDLLSASGSDACDVGAGPLEDLLSSRGQEVITLVLERCRESAPWRRAVGYVWLDAADRVGLDALAEYLPPRK